MPERCDLGILVVHGIGAQRRRDTLAEFEGALTESLSDWLGEHALQRHPTETRAGEPAHTEVTVDRGVTSERVLVAESWWAQSFTAPRWWPLAQWLLWSIPFVVFRATDHRVNLIDTNQRLDDAWSRRRRLPALGYAAVRVLKNALSVAIVMVLTIGVALLSIMALLPRLRVALLSAPWVLVRYIGDSYELLMSRERGAAMVSQVERDLAWLEGRSVGKVAILAHSQGAELVRRVLGQRQDKLPVALLVTFGSGIAKLRAVERLHREAPKALGAYLLRALAAALTFAAPVLALLDGLLVPAAVVAVVASGLLIAAARRLLKRVVEDGLLADELCATVHGKVERWLDFYATSDPVPEGPLPLHRLQRTLEAASSTRIANYRSPLHDHTSYAQNGEAFRPPVLAALADVIGWRLSKPALVVVNNARVRRERRTRLLVAARLAIGSLAVAAFASPRFGVGHDAWDDVAGWVGERVGSVVGVLGAAARQAVEGDPGRHVVCAVVLALVALALYELVFWVWRRKATRRARMLFHPSRPCGREAIGQSAPFILRPVYSSVARIAERVDRTKGWHTLPRLRGSVVLFGLRYRLRRLNLYDTPAADPPRRITFIPRLTERTRSGIGNDLCDREMGAKETYFGRNGPAFPQDDRPSAADISNELLARRAFLPARSLNLLAAAWVQFEVHDWMQHLPRANGRSCRHAEDGPLADGGTPPLATVDGSSPGSPRFLSEQTHWWDASQLYGVEKQFACELRADGGRVKVGAELLRTIEGSLGRSPSPVPNLWLGLVLFHLLFAEEHNAICAALEKSERQLNDEARYATARLINAALMAKIHTVEWTPAVIAHPTTEHAIRATWWGVLGERRRKRWGRIGHGEVLSGIPGSRTHHDGVRYSLTEEFVAVYRMHPLIPDEVTLHQVKGGKRGQTLPFEELAVGLGPSYKPGTLLEVIGCADAFFSLAIANPGEISLHNYPNFLRDLPQPHADGARMDLAQRDIERTRETALPRYNDFRRLFRLAPRESFLELANHDEKLARELEEVYGKARDGRDNVDHVDLMVGLFAEPKPRGFAFSDTAFRVFLLMAARRLRSDRFFTTDFTPAVYTATGLRWIQNRTMAKMLAEHYPPLAPALAHVSNVFKPWPRDL